MVSLIGEKEGVHYVYDTHNAPRVMKFMQEMAEIGLLQIMMDPKKAAEYEEVFMPTEAKVLEMLDGITILTKAGPRKMYIMLAEGEISKQTLI